MGGCLPHFFFLPRRQEVVMRGAALALATSQGLHSEQKRQPRWGAEAFLLFARRTDASLPLAAALAQSYTVRRLVAWVSSSPLPSVDYAGATRATHQRQRQAERGKAIVNPHLGRQGDHRKTLRPCYRRCSFPTRDNANPGRRQHRCTMIFCQGTRPGADRARRFSFYRRGL